MRLVILTGMSGAGSTAALRVFEDLGYFGVDNLPPPLLPELARRCREQEGLERAAVVIDLRAGHFFEGLPDALAAVRKAGFEVEILFLDATDDALIRRFKETRRKHPLYDKAGSVADSILQERSALSDIRETAERVLDTSRLSARDLASDLRSHYATTERPGGLQITVVSFGFKYGIPIDADLVFDLRFLRNPYWDESLRDQTGLDAGVAGYIEEDPRTIGFLDRLQELVGFTVPCYVEEGKAYLNIAVGCTGGRHRSVYIAERLATFLRTRGFQVALKHREMLFFA